MRFLGLGLADPVPDANTIWTFREALKRAGAVEALFRRFDAALRAAGYLAMGGQIIDATIVAAPKQRNTDAERAAIKAGQHPGGLGGKAGQAAAEGPRRALDGEVQPTPSRARTATPQIDLAVPAFGYKNHVSIDRRHGLIRRWTTTDAAAHDGARLAAVIDTQNTASDVWADTAYRSAKNESMVDRARPGIAYPSQEAEGAADGGADPPGERAQIRGALGGRARLCPAEGPDGAGRAHHRHRPGAGEDRPGQPGLQHAALCLAQQPGRTSVTAEAATSPTRRHASSTFHPDMGQPGANQR